MPEYHDEAWLREEYVENERSMQDIADEFGVSNTTIWKWLKKNGIERRSRGGWRRDNYAQLCANSQGYPEWRDQTGPRGTPTKTVKVHRLLAVAEFGFDAVADHVVHHKNGCKFDNRPENLEVMTQGDHYVEHIEDRVAGSRRYARNYAND